MLEPAKLASLVSAKVCHDFADTLNAIVPGLDLLMNSPLAEKYPDEVSLISQGVEKARAKLAFFRFALQDADGASDASLEDARETALLLYKQFKPDLHWNAAPTRMPLAAVRVVLNLLYIAADSAPRGSVTLESSTGEVRIIADSPKAKMKPATAAGLRGDPPEGGFDSRSIHPALTGYFARQAGLELLARESEDRVEIVVRGPSIQTISAAA